MDSTVEHGPDEQQLLQSIVEQQVRQTEALEEVRRELAEVVAELRAVRNGLQRVVSRVGRYED